MPSGGWFGQCREGNKDLNINTELVREVVSLVSAAKAKNRRGLIDQKNKDSGTIKTLCGLYFPVWNG
jgi:hypothetical protein